MHPKIYQYHIVRTSSDYESYPEIDGWLTKNIGTQESFLIDGKIVLNWTFIIDSVPSLGMRSRHVGFYNEEDAIQFKLVWG